MSSLELEFALSGIYGPGTYCEDSMFLKEALTPGTLGRHYTEKFLSAEPFPHVVIDGLFSSEILAQILEEFPGPDSDIWARFQSAKEKKLGYDHRMELSGNIAEFLSLMNSAQMLLFLEELTGIDGLIPDPYFGGAGLHQIARGGFLKIHADFNVHPKLNLDRRLNMLIYLNRDWKEEYGGHLELWDRDMRACAQRILPVFNRCVVFQTDSTSFHGHPDPLTCPRGWTRKSLSFYYYTNGRPEPEVQAAHDTVFRQRPGEDW